MHQSQSKGLEKGLSMRNNILILFSLVSIALPQTNINVDELILQKTIKDIRIKAFDVVGDRLYAVHPGSSNNADELAKFSIINLSTSLVITESGGTLLGNIRPAHIDVFNNIAILNGIFFYNISGDAINYLGDGFKNEKIMSNNGNNTVFTSNPNIMDTYKRGNILYMIVQNFGFAVYDMTDPTNPVTLKEYDYGSANDYPYGIYATQDYIITTDVTEDKIKIHKNGDDYSLIGSIDHEAHRVAMHGNLLYTAEKKIYDITDPANPVDKGAFNHSLDFSNGEMEVYGDYIYM